MNNKLKTSLAAIGATAILSGCGSNEQNIEVQNPIVEQPVVDSTPQWKKADLYPSNIEEKLTSLSQLSSDLDNDIILYSQNRDGNWSIGYKAQAFELSKDEHEAYFEIQTPEDNGFSSLVIGSNENKDWCSFDTFLDNNESLYTTCKVENGDIVFDTTVNDDGVDFSNYTQKMKEFVKTGNLETVLFTRSFHENTNEDISEYSDQYTLANAINDSMMLKDEDSRIWIQVYNSENDSQSDINLGPERVYIESRKESDLGGNLRVNDDIFRSISLDENGNSRQYDSQWVSGKYFNLKKDEEKTLQSDQGELFRVKHDGFHYGVGGIVGGDITVNGERPDDVYMRIDSNGKTSNFNDKFFLKMTGLSNQINEEGKEVVDGFNMKMHTNTNHPNARFGSSIDSRFNQDNSSGVWELNNYDSSTEYTFYHNGEFTNSVDAQNQRFDQTTQTLDSLQQRLQYTIKNQ